MKMEGNKPIGTLVCRCCAADGPFKDIVSKYNWMGEDEVYSIMLKECFDITLEMEGLEVSSGICEFCITQLRNAFNFKKQVLITETQLKDRMPGREQLTGTIDIKFENSVDSEDFDDNIVVEMLEDIEEDSDYEAPQEEESEYGSADSNPEPPKKKSTATKSKRKKTKTKSSAGRRRETRKKPKIESATPERTQHRVNLTNILQLSNATPFRDKTMKGFSCLYCSKYFKTIADLRQHASDPSEKKKLNKMIDYKLSYNPIKVDITNLYCTACNVPLGDLVELKEHIPAVHNKTIHTDIKDAILPFRLEDGDNYICVLCGVKHVSFKNLYLHMSSHYRNYCCPQCGAGFVTIAALRKHGKTHEQGSFPCSYCEKIYTSEAKKKNHEKGVHLGGWLRNKCPQCPEIFVSYYDKIQHMADVHNEKSIEYPCNACHKVYKKKFELSRHIKHHHLQLRNYLCDMCNSKFFSRRGLIDHMAKHNGEESHCCDICGKKYTTSRTLKEHIKTHEFDKRYECHVCGRKFIQKASLKTHQKLHQDDLDIFKEFDDVKHLVDDRDMTLKQIAEESRRNTKMEPDVEGHQGQFMS